MDVDQCAGSQALEMEALEGAPCRVADVWDPGVRKGELGPRLLANCSSSHLARGLTVHSHQPSHHPGFWKGYSLEPPCSCASSPDTVHGNPEGVKCLL
jgi:hypothetical protein